MQRWWWLLTASMFCIGAVPWLLAAVDVDGAYLFAFYCHQLPERTLHLHGEAMALCSRCAGIHLGLSLGAIAALVSASHEILRRHGRVMVIVAIALNLMDWTWSVWMPLSHTSRLFVGGLFGAVATAFFLASLATPRAARRAASTGARTLASSQT